MDRLRRTLEAQARPRGTFDPARYFRPSVPLVFLNVRTPEVRRVARELAGEWRATWSHAQALAFADVCIREPHLEMKAVAIESMAARQRDLRAADLTTFKRWLATNRAANWATTDLLCGTLIAPLLGRHPELVDDVAAWVSHRNLWVRRAAAVSLVRLASRGVSLDAAYGVATALRADRHDLIHKAAGWLLRECGRTDPVRLERYLRDAGPALPRTTLRYAVEHFSPARRAAIMRATRAPVGGTGDARRVAPRADSGLRSGVRRGYPARRD